MKFGKIDHFIVLGGSLITLYFLKHLKKKKIKFHYFTNKRQLQDTLTNGKSLIENLKSNLIKFNISEDINKENKIQKVITKNSMTIGFGEPWPIKAKLLKKFKGRIVDFMGIPLPQYRGGAHYSWMILNDSRDGGCFLQNLNDKTLQGSSDTGNYYMSYNYKYPKSLNTPKDYFKYSITKELFFLKKFLKKINSKNNMFILKKFNENNSILFPRLISAKNGFIDWSNSADEIVRFINAFSEPYSGAISFYGKKKVFLKNAKLIKKNNFHSYTSGLIVNKIDNNLIIAGKRGLISVKDVKNEKNENLFKLLKVGNRISTTNKYVVKSKIHLKF